MSGQDLRVIRKMLGLTQIGLAIRLGVTGTTVARWERGAVPVAEPAARLVRLLAEMEAIPMPCNVGLLTGAAPEAARQPGGGPAGRRGRSP